MKCRASFRLRNPSPPATETAGIALDAPQQDLPVAPNGFIKLGLAPELMRAVDDLGFTQPTPVQDQTIPLAMAPEDAATASST